MVTRVPALNLIADALEQTFVATENLARQARNAPPPYNTSLGRGVRDGHVPVGWTWPIVLASAIGDAKNTATELPRYGELRLAACYFEDRETTVEGNTLNHLAPTNTKVRKFASFISPAREGETFSARVISDVDLLVRNWNDDEFCELIERSYEAVIDLGSRPSVQVSVICEQTGGVSRWSRDEYRPLAQQPEMPGISCRAPILRRAVITGRHLLILAALWRDTLQHTAASQPNSEPLPADGGQDHVEQSARPRKTKVVRGKTAKAVEAPPSTASDKLGSPANPQQAFQQSCSRDDTLSLSMGARGVAASLDAAADLRRGHQSTVNPELFQDVKPHDVK